MSTATEEGKLRILSQGLHVPPDVAQAIAAFREGAPVVHQDYVTTSGLTLRLSEDVYVNAPLSERSEVQLALFEGEFVVEYRDFRVPAEILPFPSYLSQSNEDGVPYPFLIATQTDRVRVAPIAGCSLRCRFCDLPYSFQYEKKSIPGLVQAVQIALDDERLPARHVLVSGGTPTPTDRPYLLDAIREIVSATNVPVDVMMVPWADRELPEILYDSGVAHLFFNMELFDPKARRTFMPGKARTSPAEFLRLIEAAVNRFGKGKVLSLILVGLEDPSQTLQGVEALADMGCLPVLSPFRPSPVTPLAHLGLPVYETLRLVHDESSRLLRSRQLWLGPSCVPCQHNTLAFPGDISPLRSPGLG